MARLFWSVELKNGTNSCGHKHKSYEAAEKCREKLLDYSSDGKSCSAYWWESYVAYHVSGYELVCKLDEDWLCIVNPEFQVDDYVWDDAEAKVILGAAGFGGCCDEDFQISVLQAVGDLTRFDVQPGDFVVGGKYTGIQFVRKVA